jgi:16S rRNA C967 or C1407 C5-methylase (RsmB/RsmF family)/NOL1/NOP2/fmu family ribosome biogenesis protein
LLPKQFIDSLVGLPGFQKIPFEQVHTKSEQITSLRINKFKQFEVSIHPFLQNTSSIPWCNNGVYLNERPLFVKDPLWHAGAYYVQEASSMFIQYLLEHLNIKTSSIVLDLCAAPGGKSTLLANWFSDGLVVANETIKGRNAILVENITKWGADNMVVTQNDPAHFKALPSFFDVLMIDAPCSGSGLFRKDATAISEWSLESVQHCSLRQQRIIEESLDTLKEGGYLIYSTCSYSFEEDEKIMDHIASHPGMVNVQISVPENWNIVSCNSPVHQCQGFRFYPDQIKGEGFFISIFKKEQTKYPTAVSDTFKFTPVQKNELAVVQSFFELPTTYQYLSHQNSMIAIPQLYEPTILSILSHLYVKKLGVELGTVKGKDFIPSHALGMSYWQKLPYKKMALNRSMALDYLRRAEIKLEGNAGWHLMTYQGIGLGWAKILPNRVNNYYPNEWRILNY